jgi:hypothetical protein
MGEHQCLEKSDQQALQLAIEAAKKAAAGEYEVANKLAKDASHRLKLRLVSNIGLSLKDIELTIRLLR